MKKLIAISLSLILLLGNMGLTVATHYCGGQVAKSGLRLGGDTFDCGMKESGDRVGGCEREGVHFSASRCCDNMQQLVSTDDSCPVDGFSVVSADSLSFFPSFSFSFLSTLSIGKSIAFFYAPPPHLPHKDRQVLFQTFLI